VAGERPVSETLANSDVAGLMASWLPRQRWFAGEHGGVTLTSAGHVRLADPYPAAAGRPVDIVVHFVRATPAGGAEDAATTYQVPLTYRTAEDPDLGHALLGDLLTDDGPRFVYDAAHDPAFVAAWLGVVAGRQDVWAEPDAPRARVRGVPRPTAAPPDPSRPGRVLSGEQSNTSIVIGAGAGAEGTAEGPAILKLFRVLQAGRNPDVTVTAALAAAGCERVPALLGWVEGEWVDPTGLPAWGHLSAMAEFVAGSQDGWRIATRAVHDGESFAAEAAELGAATAAVHEALARAMPSRPTAPSDLASIADHLDQRLRWALEAVPALAEYADAAAAVVAAVRSVAEAPDMQLIHADLHLGQALRSDARGWVLLDFEGEPLRPLAERGQPDLALRDVAGMLRSFDYAARHSVLGFGDDDPRAVAAAAWAAACREAFLDGYAAEAKHDPRDDAVLLTAMELDKALYETVYETRHRPGWVEVPLRAVASLLD
jgi:maltokinase